MKTNLSINIGKDEYGHDLIINLPDIKNLLIAGYTGSGKSTLIHKLITTLVTNNSPEELKLILIDTKRVELRMYNKIPHLLTPAIYEHRKAVLAMKWALKEMDKRFDILNECNSIDITKYKGSEKMPPILLVIDELSDLMELYPKEIETALLKIARMGHSVGIYMIVSTSRPTIKVYTKSIQEAFNSRIGLQTSTPADSRLIIGSVDACKLRGSGDLLFRIGMKYVIRAQIDNVSKGEVKKVVSSIQNKYEVDVEPKTAPDSVLDDSDNSDDSLYEEVKNEVLRAGKASTSFIQRKFGIGYARACRLIDKLEKKGIIGPSKGSSPRKVLKK